MGKRVGTSILGIPIWGIIGISIFIIFSVGYDLIVRDVNNIRVGLLIGASIILLIAIGMQVVSKNFVAKIARRQFGG